MKIRDRKGEEIFSGKTQETILRFFYGTDFGRKLLQIMIQPRCSRLVGKFMDSSLSKCLVPVFIKKNHIDLSEYQKENFDSFNDCFCRKIKPELRPIDLEKTHFIAPCDSKLTICKIEKDSTFYVKDTYYTMEQLTHSKKLSKAYEGGYLMIFRLSVEDYHHYCYVDAGSVSRNYHIPGVFHTVHPSANDCLPIYKENTREFSLLNSENFGTILMMEVGALLVGRITNKRNTGTVVRGEEKGYFEYGGSTVILCVKKNQVLFDPDIFENSIHGVETKVCMGEKIGVRIDGDADC